MLLIICACWIRARQGGKKNRSSVDFNHRFCRSFDPRRRFSIKINNISSPATRVARLVFVLGKCGADGKSCISLWCLLAGTLAAVGVWPAASRLAYRVWSIPVQLKLRRGWELYRKSGWLTRDCGLKHMNLSLNTINYSCSAKTLKAFENYIVNQVS